MVAQLWTGRTGFIDYKDKVAKTEENGEDYCPRKINTIYILDDSTHTKKGINKQFIKIFNSGQVIQVPQQFGHPLTGEGTSKEDH